MGISEVEQILSSYFDVEISLIEAKYYKVKRNREEIYSYSNLSTPMVSPIYQIGIAFLIVGKNGVKILPPILNIIKSNIQQLVVGSKKAKMISFNKSIQIDSSDLFYLLKDNFGRKISIGWVKDKIFSPNTDLGWYLREEN
jgi:hypothetical protein